MGDVGTQPSMFSTQLGESGKKAQPQNADALLFLATYQAAPQLSGLNDNVDLAHGTANWPGRGGNSFCPICVSRGG